MGASFARIVENDAHHVLIRNGDGEHTIFKEIHRDASGQAGPGYVARVRSTQGVWIVDDKSEVKFRFIKIASIGQEEVVVSRGVDSDEKVVALGAHLLHEGQVVNLAKEEKTSYAKF